ncbi:MAG: GNAT family N-acetyltransferase [Pseudomonadota bacterium]
MTLEHLRIAVDWAAAEGWNPGREDAEAFHAVDPGGFLMGWLGHKPVTAISVVRHSDAFGFLGFYLCHPDHRGMGFGMATWQAGMAYMGNRTVGLDGVPAQEANYEDSGFVLSHYTRRHAGSVAGEPHQNVRPAASRDLPVLLALDSQITGTDRTAYLSGWFTETENRKTVVFDEIDRIAAVGTIRQCRDGHKIGPLFAPDAETALALLRSLVATANAQYIMIDIPDTNTAGVEIAEQLGLQSAFSCARMYRGDPLNRHTSSIFGETSFELG